MNYYLTRFCNDCKNEDVYNLSKIDAAFQLYSISTYWDKKCTQCHSTNCSAVSQNNPNLDKELLDIWGNDLSLFFSRQDEDIILAEIENLKLIIEAIDHSNYPKQKIDVLISSVCVLYYDNCISDEDYTIEENEKRNKIIASIKPELIKRKNKIINSQDFIMNYIKEIVFPEIGIYYKKPFNLLQKMKNLFLLSLLVLTTTITAQQKTRFDKIDSLLVYLNQNHKFMGQVSIREAGKVVFEKGYGYSDVANSLKADENTKYKIGSITKTFTAVMIMQLIEEKKLKQETKLSKFYPQIQNSDKITIHDLLHHRTGIIDYLNADNTTDVHKNMTKEEMMAKIAAYQSLFEPNSKFEYSNSNYYILGRILEDVTKKDYTTNLQERIIQKLSLRNTYISDKVDPAKNESYSYTFSDKKWTLFPEWDMSIAFGAGNISSTASDLTLLLDGLFSEKLLKKSSVDEMIKLEQSYGIGLVTFPFGERKYFGHNGSIEGFRSVVGYYPTEKTGISLIVNGDNFNRNDIMIGILSIYYKMPYQFPNVITFEVSPETLKKYEGVYATTALPIKITIKADKGELTAQATGQSAFTLNAISENEFVFDPAGVKLTFDGKNMTLKQGGGQYIFTKE